MRDEVRQLIDALREEAVMKEGLAHELANLADEYEQNDHHLRAEGMRSLSRHHRIRCMQVGAQIAALTDQYAHLLRTNY
jgi:signal transduction histidine kinase